MPEVRALPEPLRTIHIMGIGGTAMAALAQLLVARGLKVTGSDARAPYPPMSDVLAKLGIKVMVGYRPENLDHHPDLVVVGNAIRPDYDEAKALVASDLPYMSFPALMGSAFLQDKHSLVVAGTHGKTTTTALCAWLLEAAGRQPGFLVGGAPLDFDGTARAATGDCFVIEGDEYDTAFFDKGPKFLHYRPKTAIVTSVEFDHADIYRDLAHVQESFRKLAALVPEDGAIVARWDHPTVVEAVQGARCEILRYGKDQHWDGQIVSVDHDKGTMTFTVLHDGKPFGTFTSLLVGEHNLYNQVAATAALARLGLSADELAAGFRSFHGIKRRQEVRGNPGGITVVDDFAHHPTAVKVTLEALRLRFGPRRMWAVFEPRSNTSRRRIFQKPYAEAFDCADVVVIAPALDLDRIDQSDRFSTEELVADLRSRGKEAFVWGRPAATPTEAEAPNASAESVADGIAAALAANAMPEDVVAVLSNGGFGGLHQKLLAALGERFKPR